MHLANHTDAPQANMWPWFGMEAIVTRGYPGKPDVPPMGPDQALTLEETIRIHTINGAWTLRLEDVTGSIEVGRSADIIVLNGDVLRFLSKKNDVWFPKLKPVPVMGTEKENHTSWERYYRVSDCSSSSRNNWYLGR